MSFSLDSYLGVHQPALHMQARRAEVLASNLANVDTPGYKARDIDFRAVMATADDEFSPGRLAATRSMHIQPEGSVADPDLMYRNPHQASLDGNTVEHQVELAAYTDNSMRYLMSLNFLNGKFDSLRTAIRGQ